MRQSASASRRRRRTTSSSAATSPSETGRASSTSSVTGPSSASRVMQTRVGASSSAQTTSCDTPPASSSLATNRPGSPPKKVTKRARPPSTVTARAALTTLPDAVTRTSYARFTAPGSRLSKRSVRCIAGVPPTNRITTSVLLSQARPYGLQGVYEAHVSIVGLGVPFAVPRVGLVDAESADYVLGGFVQRIVDADPDPGAQGRAQSPRLPGPGDLDGLVQGVGEHLRPDLAAGAPARKPYALHVEGVAQQVDVGLVVEDGTFDESTQHVAAGVPAAQAEESTGSFIAVRGGVEERVVEDPRLLVHHPFDLPVYE